MTSYKYPTFKSFLIALNAMDWTGSTAYSVEEYRIQKNFELDRIYIKTYFSSGRLGQHFNYPNSIEVTIGKTLKKFEQAPTKDAEKLIKRAFKWVYDNYYKAILIKNYIDILLIYQTKLQQL